MTFGKYGIKFWVFINGPSGAGKTKVASVLGDRYGYNVLKVGPYFRANSASFQSEELDTALKYRIPIPNKYIEPYILKHAELDGNVYLVDGLPRSMENIVLIDKLAPSYFFPIFVSINISFKISVERVMDRRVCIECGNINNESICKRCGVLTLIRSDDAKTDIELLKDRYLSMQSVVHALSRKHKVHMIDGEKTTEHIVMSINKIIQQNIQNG